METTLMEWLERTGSSAFTYSLWAFLLLNGAALVAVVVTKDRTLVNRWTGRLLGANLLLLGTGVGVPMLMSVARVAITVVSPTLLPSYSVGDKASSIGDKTRAELIGSTELERGPAR